MNIRDSDGILYCIILSFVGFNVAVSLHKYVLLTYCLCSENYEVTMVTKKSLLVLAILIASVLMFVGCASAPEEPAPTEIQGTVQSEVLEHKGSALGLNELPVWVETYILDGITGLEEMSDFSGEYCFVAETAAQNINAAQAWVEGFNMPQTIARNVSTRVEGIFSGAESGAADGEYSTYFENIVKTVTETEFSGARKENDWWVLTRRYDSDSKSKYTDEYRAYVLYTMPKDLLDQQVLSVIERIEQENVLTSDDSATNDRVKELLSSSGL